MSIGNDFPRAHIHRQILDTAESRPEASMQDIALDVSGATTNLVERVLDEYGDPGVHHASSEDSPDMEQQKAYPDPEDLTDAQRETLRAIHKQPSATQQELADRFDITTATVSQRVNSIEGFDWSDRLTFVSEVFDGNETHPDGGSLESKVNGSDPGGLEDVCQRLTRLEERIEIVNEGSSVAFDDPELVRKVLHACLNSETITEDEELDIIRELVQR